LWCVDEDPEPLSYETVEAKGAEITGILVALIVGSVILTIVALDMLTLLKSPPCRRCQRKQAKS